MPPVRNIILIIRINHPDKASMRMGIGPVAKLPGRMNDTVSPNRLNIAGYVEIATLKDKRTRDTIPFPLTLRKGISMTPNRGISKNAVNNVMILY